VGDEQRVGYEQMLARSREAFDAVPDFTVAVEEEFALLDPETLDLVNRFEELQEAAKGTELEPHLVGELIASEIEIRTGRCDAFADAATLIGERRQQLRALTEPRGVALGATGTHPWSPWQEQRIIDTPHYRLNDEVLRYVVWRNNSFGQHVHVGIRGADRAIRVCATLRNYLPELLALSGSSPFVEGVFTYLHSARTQIHAHVPGCGIPTGLAARDEWRAVRFLYETHRSPSRPRSGSVRPHSPSRPSIRICDAQATSASRARSRPSFTRSPHRPPARSTRASRCPTCRTGWSRKTSGARSGTASPAS
jgi:carboxylate-amine ligase